MVYQGEMPSFSDNSAEVYAPAPKNSAWPKFTWPV